MTFLFRLIFVGKKQSYEKLQQAVVVSLEYSRNVRLLMILVDHLATGHESFGIRHVVLYFLMSLNIVRWYS